MHHDTRRRGAAIRPFTIAAAALALAAGPAAAQEPPLELTRVDGPIRIDGVPDEAAWRELPALPLTMYQPVFGGEPTQRTQIRVGYDDEFFYAAGWFYDTEPAGIRVNSLYRDRWNGDDAFAIYLDVFNDNLNAKWFGTTPAGMRFDLLVSNDGATVNDSWDTFWDAESTITGEGWFAEVRIPFSSLGFQAVDGRAVMGLTVTRLVSRLNERVTFPAIDPAMEFRRPSVARDIVLEGVRSDNPLHVTPYVLSGVQQRPSLVAGADEFGSDRRVPRELGLDLRYALSAELTLDVTANTDFAQVEADDQQVNLDRFSLFFPEKRRFFQERSELFDFATIGGGRLFHSRQIGLTPDFEPVPVLGGARLVGRAGAWDLGFLGMRTEEFTMLPAENFGVLRLRRPVLNPWSTVGAMATSRTSDGAYNHALGLDGSFRLLGDHYLALKWAATFDDEEPASVDFAERSLFDARWERRTARGLAYSFSAGRTGAAYRPELGFLPRSDFTRADVLANWFWFTDDHPVFRRIFPGMLAFSTFRNADGALESGTYAVWVQWETKAGGGGWIEPKWFHEDVVAPFTIGDEVDIPAGTYDFADLQLVFVMPSGRRLRTSVDFRTGTYFDGTRTQVILGPTWNLSRHLELGGEYQLSMLRFDDRGQRANIQVGRLRIRTALDAKTSGNALLQYNSTTDRMDVSFRLRYNFAEGTDLWLVYNEALDTDRRRDDPLVPREPLSAARALIVKWTYTFQL